MAAGTSSRRSSNRFDTNYYLSAIERSERNNSIDNIARIAKGLRVEPWILLKNE
jgi:transcriptional regulator with XRE-family HTH domain